MRQKKTRVPDFAGVALVDILANGVAVLIIIIVLSISSRLEVENSQLEQVDEVAATLSRKFTNSIVMNRLAASRPARLHDYNSPLDQVRDPQLLPIVELHRDFVRDLHSGRVYQRDELLLQDNGLDRLFAGYTPLQRSRIRTDIYHIRQFYLATSIMKANGIVPRHWHFLTGGGASIADVGLCPPGVEGSECRGLGAGLAAQQSSAEALAAGAGEGGSTSGVAGDGSEEGEGKDSQSADSKGGKGEGDSGEEGGDSVAEGGEGSSSGKPGGSAGGQNSPPTQHLPQAASFSALGGVSAGSEGQNQLFPPSPAGQLRAGNRQGVSAAEGENSEYNNLIGSMGSSNAAIGSGGQIRPRRARFRLSAPEKQRQENAARWGPARTQQQTLPARQLPPLRDIIPVLLEYLRDLQSYIDRGQSPMVLMNDYKRYLAQRFANPPPVRPAEQALVEDLVEQFSSYWPDDSMPEVEAVRDDSLAAHVLALRPNTGIDNLTVSGNAGQEPVGGVPGQLRPSLNLQLYPTIYRGLNKEIDRYGVLLIPPSQAGDPEFKWRAVTYITPQFDDFVTGFVYSAFDDSGQLQIEVDSNRVQLNKLPLRTVYRVREISNSDWLAIFYSIALLVLLLLVIFLRLRLPWRSTGVGV